MNHIKRLQANDLEVRRWIERFKQHLTSDKFIGFDGTERKDWISTGDVIRWIDDLQFMLIDKK